MNFLTPRKLSLILPSNQFIQDWYNALDKILPEYEINTINRVGAFLGQCKHESQIFTRLRENLNYRPESLIQVWPTHFPTMEIAQKYAHNEQAIANRAYANRMGNGPEESGDGWKFCGKGLIQMTGRQNYEFFADSVQMNVEDVPAYLLTFEGAVQGSCFFWETNNLNNNADAGDITGMTHVINGGELGLAERTTYIKQAIQILSSQ